MGSLSNLMKPLCRIEASSVLTTCPTRSWRLVRSPVAYRDEDRPLPYFPCAICSAVDDVRCELKLSSDVADCGILNVTEFDVVANDATITGAAAARQHSSITAAPMQLYFIIMVSKYCFFDVLSGVAIAFELKAHHEVIQKFCGCSLILIPTYGA